MLRLARVDRAEVATRSALRARNLMARDLRMRDLGEDVRVEVDPWLLPELADATDIIDAGAAVGLPSSDGSCGTARRMRERRLLTWEGWANGD